MAESPPSSADAQVSAAARPRRRRWPWIVLAVLVVLFLLRGPLLAPVVTRLAAHYLGQAITGEATVAGASGGWLNHTRLIGIRASSPLGSVRALTIGEIRATYGLRIMLGDPAALRSLRLTGVELELDLRSAGSAEGALPPLLELLPRPLPVVEVQGTVRLLLPQGEVQLRDLRLQSAGDQIALHVIAQVGDSTPVPLAARFTRSAADTLRLDQAVTINEATIEALSVVLGRRQQQVQATISLGGGRLELHAEPTRVTLAAQGLDLAAIPESVRALLPADPGVVRGTLALEGTAIRAASGWNVAGSVRASEILVAGVGPFTLTAQGHLGAGNVQVPLISLSGPAAGTLRLTDVVFDLASRRPLAGLITCDIADVASWLPLTMPRLPTALALRATMSVDGDVLAIRTADLTGGGVSARVRGSIATRPWRLEAADVQAQADLASLAGLLPQAPNLAGTVQVRVGGTLPFSTDLAALLAQPLRVSARGDGLTVAATQVDGLRVELATVDGRLQVERAEAQVSGTSSAGFGAARIGINARGSATRTARAWDAVVEQVVLTLPGTTVTTREPFPLLLASDHWSTGVMRLGSAAGDLTAEVRHAQGLGLLQLSAPALDLARLGISGVTGKAELQIALSGAWERPVGEVQVVAQDLRIDDRHLQIALRVVQDHQGLTIHRGRIDAGADGHLTMSGTLPLVLGSGGVTVVADDGQPAALALAVPAIDRWLPTLVDAGAAEMALTIGTATDPAALTGALTLRGLRPTPAGRQGWRRSVPQAELAGEVALAADAQGLRLSLVGSTDGQQVITGQLRSLGAWDPVQLVNAWRARALDGQVTLSGVELGRFVAAVPGVLHLTGRADGALTLSGTLGAPTSVGTLTLSDVEAKVASLVPTLTDGRARVELADGKIRLVDGVADLGGTPLTISGTWDLTHDQQLAVQLDGSNVLLVQRHDARVRADLALTLTGTPGMFTLAGSAVVTNALFSPDLSLLGLGSGGTRGDGRLVAFEFTEPPLSTLRFDVAISSRQRQRHDGVRLATNLVRADCDLDLRLRGTGATPELAGRITVREGLVALPFSTLRLNTGEIQFPEGDPFHPRIKAVANAQVRRWRVTLQVDGALSDPQVRANADGLDQRDAMLLLTTGTVSAELDQEEGQYAVVTRLGTWLGREAWDLIDGEADPDAGPSVFERLTLDVGRNVSSEGRDTIEAQVELTDPDLVPGVLLYGERDRWDDYNAGLILRFRWGGEE